MNFGNSMEISFDDARKENHSDIFELPLNHID